MKEITIDYNGKRLVNFTKDDALSHGVPMSVVLAAFKRGFESSVDSAAGKARSAFVSLGAYIDQEYLLAKQEAQAWLDGGKDQSAIPSSVEDHIAMFDVGAEAAAQEIVATAAQWEQALGMIRRVRLGGKSDVRAAETIEAAEAAAQDAIAALNDIRPPEGEL